MECLYCGDCCLRMCPFSEKPCPKIIKKDTFYFCNNYEGRPKECQDHKFNGFKVCPIGLNKLELKNRLQIFIRIDEGWKIIREI